MVQFYIGAPDPIAITETEYRKCCIALGGILVAVGIEEKFDIVISNYVALEKFLADMCLKHVVYMTTK